MPGNFYDKFPEEILDFDLDASDILLNGDTIASVDIEPLGGGIAIPSSSFSGSIISIRVSGGTEGQIAFAVANVHLASGQLRQAPLSIIIKPLPGA